MAERDLVMVLAASYDSVSDAVVDYEAIKALYHDAGTSHAFDAVVLERDEDGKVHVVKQHEEATRHGAATGLKWGLAIGAATAIFPPIGLAGGLIVGGAAGSAIGAVTGHMKDGIDEDDLQHLGEVLNKGEVGLIAVYATNLADQIAQSVKAENRYVTKATDARADELAKQIKDAES